MAIRAIITGASGMVGEGVALTCLSLPEVEQVLIIGRRPSGLAHPKLKEIIVEDFFNLAPYRELLAGYNACYFCLGTTSVGKSPEEYYKTTYTLTLNFAQALCAINKEITFCYVSGGGTDSTEKGKLYWARVKGKTENDLLKLPFKAVYNFRPGFLQAVPGQKHTLSYYRYFAWLYPLLKTITPNHVSTLSQLARAFTSVTQTGYPKHILEVADINKLSTLS